MVRSRTQRAVRALSGRLLSRAVMASTLAGVMVAQAAWSPGSAAAVGDSEAGGNAPVQEADGEAPGADVAVPTVTGPVTGGTRGMPFNGLSQEFLQQHGYVEEEFFIEGEATAYAPEGELGEDGRWTVTEESTAPYTTRILVRRPADAADFDGSVFVEWFNVSAGFDNEPDIGWAHDELVRSGSVFVGVSAQQVGVEGSGFTLPIPGAPPQTAPKVWDPERYEPISHPGDQYSYDIFSQAAQALRRPGEVDPMGGLTPETIIGMGQSQSAARMAAYVNAVQPVAGIYDGLVVHSRGAGAASLEAGGSPIGDGVARLRDDLDVPVLQLQTEAEVAGGSIYGEQTATYYTLAWFDRYLAPSPSSEQADDALRRLTASGTDPFDGSSDLYSIGTGFYDPARAEEARNPKAGNVPITIGGTPVRNLLSFQYDSRFFLDGGALHCDNMRAGCPAPHEPNR